jgi:zinc transport system substrate-binding protein
VLHPSWGYFARDYGLRQLAVQIEGKAPKPRQLMQLIGEAGRAKVRALFVQPEFSDKSARLLARELGIPVIKLSPLAPDWEKTLLKLAESIAGVEGP